MLVFLKEYYTPGNNNNKYSNHSTWSYDYNGGYPNAEPTRPAAATYSAAGVTAVNDYCSVCYNYWCTHQQ